MFKYVDNMYDYCSEIKPRLGLSLLNISFFNHQKGTQMQYDISKDGGKSRSFLTLITYESTALPVKNGWA